MNDIITFFFALFSSELYMLVKDRVPKIVYSGAHYQASWPRLFFFFCQIFGIFDYFQRFAGPSAWSSKWHKNDEKSCSVCLKPISPCYFQKPRFRVPHLSLRLFMFTKYKYTFNLGQLKWSIFVCTFFSKRCRKRILYFFWRYAVLICGGKNGDGIL